ncbi:MAG: hypothetical protein TR69_WS6001000581 [candidate division WS6 bacterium OLB20]|uniref:Uncharacterized protein n=1 Tax=candidate division WS6 bacterium OLB20 TaxID=1617426 RepID=A0A136LY55_9BACT|nr:MAG: hypothetical protein TR69_WS6001000581 [candidate division WS6 bacterium OLB20]
MYRTPQGVETYYMFVDANTYEQITPGNGRGMCTVAGNNRVQFCNVTAPPSNAVAFAYPASFQRSGNSVIVNWQLGLLGASTFPRDNQVHVHASDIPGANSGWIADDLWKVDLNPPVVGATLNLLSETSFNVTYSANDSLSGVLATAKSCSSNLQGNESIVLMQDAPAVNPNSQNFTGSQTRQTCFDNATGQTRYSVSNTPRDGSFSFDWNATDYACNRAPSVTAQLRLKKPWLMTVDGDLFSRLGISQTTIADIERIQSLFLTDQHNRVPYLSDYNFMSGQNSLPARDSELDFAVRSYLDANGKPRDELAYESWYDLADAQLESRLQASQQLTAQGPVTFADVTTHQIAQTLGSASIQPDGFPASEPQDRLNVIRVQGDLRLNRVTCNTKTVFLVSGNLTLEPEIGLQDNPAADIVNGCLFLVKETTTILPGQSAGTPGDTTPDFDTVAGFIVTRSIQIPPDPQFNALRVTGSIIASENNTFDRDAGVVLNQLSPSEIIYYDGGRYMHLFGEVLSMPVSFNIVEKPFLDSF